MKPHPHAELMAEYAKDAAETDTPWERWERMFLPLPERGWEPMNSRTSIANLDYAFRRKPKTININGFEVPEPMRVKPEKGSKYYLTEVDMGARDIEWDDDETDNRWLKSGICHATAEAAELHRKALLSFTALP